MRITDGRIAKMGVTQPGDRPVIGPNGVLYQDDLMIANDRDASGRLLPVGRRTVALKLLTLAAVRSGLEAVQEQVTSPISAFAMDGPRVAYAVRDPRGACDAVRFWGIPWNFTAGLTRPSGPTCLSTRAGGITSVAIAGSRAIWTTTDGQATRVLAASITDCQEWVVARPASVERVVGLAGDGRILAYAFAPSGPGQRVLSSVGFVPPWWRGLWVEQSRDRVVALSAYDGRIAALGTSGAVVIKRPGGKLIGRLQVGPARAVALRKNIVAALSNDDTVDVYSLSTGRRLHSWKVAPGATSLDVQYGIALFTAGRDAFALDLRTGHTARVFHAPAALKAQIESPGAAIQFNVGGHGYLEFVPMSEIEASTR